MRAERWNTPEEVLPYLDPIGIPARGGPVLLDGKVFSGEGHSLYLGTTGAGKSRRGTIPLALSKILSGESLLVVDPKGEIYKHTAAEAEKRHYKILFVNFLNVYKSMSWNPLESIRENFLSGDRYRVQAAQEMLDDLALAIFPSAAHKEDYWPLSARSLFLGAADCLLRYAPDQATLSNIFELINSSSGLSNKLRALVDAIPASIPAAKLLSNFISAPSDTRNSIASVFMEHMSIFSRNEGLISMLSQDELHINDLDCETPTIIYIILPDNLRIFDSIASVLVCQLMSHFNRIAMERYGGTLPRRLNLILEELGNLGGSLPDLPSWMTSGRSRNIQLYLVLQSLSQLDTIYGESKSITICSNTDLMIAYRCNHLNTLQKLSALCGEKTVRCGSRVSHEKLITPAQLGTMEVGQALVRLKGQLKFVTWLPDVTELYPDLEVRTELDWLERSSDGPTLSQFSFAEILNTVKVAHRCDQPSDAALEILSRIQLQEKSSEDIDEDNKEDEEDNPWGFLFEDNPTSILDEQSDVLEESPAKEDTAERSQSSSLLDQIQPPPEDDQPPDPVEEEYHLTVLSLGPSKVVPYKALMDHLGYSLSEIKKMLSPLPCTSVFPSREKALAAQRIIFSQGGIAYIDPAELD